MDFYGSDPVACLLDSSIGVTIYDENFELIAWNDAYYSFGITPKQSIKTRLNLCDTYTLASRLGVFGSDEPKKLARIRFEQALNKTAPTTEILHLPNGGTTIIRRMFLPNIGVAALFSRPDDLRNRWAEERANVERKAAQLARREVSHAYNNHLTKILAHLELAKATGDTEHLRKAEDLCCTPVRPR